MTTVGYYDMSRGSGQGYQRNEIEDAGYSAISLQTLSEAELAGIDTLYALNPDNGRFGSEYRNSLTQIEAAVQNGMNLVIFDRQVGNAESILPGGLGLDIRRDFRDDSNIQIAGGAPDIFTNGPGGPITDQTLDNGTSSSHGYALLSSLPPGAVPLLTTGNPEHVVAFTYQVGAGTVFYSTIPLDFYSNANRGSITPAEVTTLVANTLALVNGGAVVAEDTTLDGTPGDDLLSTGAGNDLINGLAGDDRLFGGLGDDTLNGDAGHDTLFGSIGNDTLFGGDGNDTLNGGVGTDQLFGGADNDWLYGEDDRDTLDGGAGDDRLFGGKRKDILRGGDGDDTLLGEDGFDALYGQDGDDSLDGGTGRDRLFGGAGNDTLRGGAGSDTVGGGAGDDLIRADDDGWADRYIGGAGIDTVSYFGTYGPVRASLVNPGANSGAAALDSFQGIENLTGTWQDDVLVGNGTANTLTGNDGNDRLFGLEGADVLQGGSGNDLLVGGDSTDLLEGNAGDDTLKGGNGADTLLGGAGDDLLIGGQGADDLHGGQGRDVADYSAATQGLTIALLGQAQNAGAAAGDRLTSIEEIIGTFYDDVIRGNGFGNALRGNNGDDDLVGYAGNDRLFGGNGNDTLTGGLDDDLLVGGGGADTFVFRPGHGNDRIGDFRDNTDSLVLDAGLWAGTLTAQQVLDQYATADGNDVLFTFGGGETLRLAGYLQTNSLNSLADDIAFL